MLSTRFLRMYGERRQRSVHAMNDPRSVAEFEATSRDFVNDRPEPEPAKPEQAGEEAQESQVGVAPQPGQRAAPGRRPLFRS
jgi:hypothetical protein